MTTPLRAGKLLGDFFFDGFRRDVVAELRMIRFLMRPLAPVAAGIHSP
jgi:hypothetical protein